jgi:hypothetical protein
MKISTLALSAALALSAGASFAQAPPPPGAPGPRAEGRHWQRPDPAQMAERHAQHLRDALQLRPDQEPALQAFIGAMKPPEGMREHMRHEEGGAALTTPQRLDRAQARMAEHEAKFRARAEAIKRFYGQLSPAQQKAFDALHEGMGGRHGFHGGHGMHGPGGFGGHGR